MLGSLKRGMRDQTGVTAIEYGLIAAMVGVAIIGGISLLGTSLDDIFGAVGSKVEDANPAGGGTGGTGTGGTGTGGTGA